MLQFSLTKKILIWVVVVLGFLFAMPNGFYNRVESVNDARMQLENGNDTPEIISQASNWPSFLPSALVNLGLDLRGGAHLLARVRVDQVYEARMDAYWPEVRNALRKERASIGTIRRIDGENYDLRVRISEPSQINHAVEVVSALARPVTTLSGAGSRDIVVTSIEDTIIIELSEAEKIATDTRTMDQSLEIIRRRVDEAGTREPTIQRQGTDRVLIQVPGIGSAEELKSIIGKTAKLTFHKVIQRTSNSDERVKNRQILLPAQDESRNSASRNAYHTSLRPSSLFEPSSFQPAGQHLLCLLHREFLICCLNAGNSILLHKPAANTPVEVLTRSTPFECTTNHTLCQHSSSAVMEVCKLTSYLSVQWEQLLFSCLDFRLDVGN